MSSVTSPLGTNSRPQFAAEGLGVPADPNRLLVISGVTGAGYKASVQIIGTSNQMGLSTFQSGYTNAFTVSGADGLGGDQIAANFFGGILQYANGSGGLALLGNSNFSTVPGVSILASQAIESATRAALWMNACGVSAGSAAAIGNANTLFAVANNATPKLSILGNGSVTFASIDGLTSGNLNSGTYTPTLFNVTNMAASTAFACQYLRVGNTVVVSGRVNVDPTAAAAATELGISLPIASNFGATTNCGGTANGDAVVSESASIEADAANDRAAMKWITTSLAAHDMFFCFSYTVI